MGVSKSYPQDQLHIDNCTKFCNDVDIFVRTKNLSYIQAVLATCEKRKIEPELSSAYVNPEIIEHLRIEYENLHMLQKTAKLPF